MPHIVPHLWYDKEAKEAAALYTSIFPSSRIKSISSMSNTPSGDVDLVSIELAGQEFFMISAGPYFKFTPAISFLVSCATSDEVDGYWRALSEGGRVLMELGAYPFSDRYGWLQDRYGLSWQIMLDRGEPLPQKIRPVLMFVGSNAGRCEEAIREYASIFAHSAVGETMRYAAGEAPDREGTVKFAHFKLENYHFGAMDSAHPHDFNFNEAVSLMVMCENQNEIDHYWSRLSAVPQAEQCGWLKDKYGLSWQIAPTAMTEMMSRGTPRQMAKVTEAFMQMKKFDLAALERAYAAAAD